ncbi:MAG: hypothetical protein GEV06_28325, partial [Luteitalea sp.]|nr:hypothetical protein [Luteitalea sp.]
MARRHLRIGHHRPARALDRRRPSAAGRLASLVAPPLRLFSDRLGCLSHANRAHQAPGTSPPSTLITAGESVSAILAERDFEQWRARDLADAAIRYVFLDGWYPKVRLGKRRVTVPVLVVLGVRADGQRELLDLRLVGDESTAAWRECIQGLVARRLGTPVLAVIDGSAGLAAALREVWPTLAIQRCTTHKLRNLEAKAPTRLREELKEDYRRMIYADSQSLVEQARARFVKKWRLQCPAVVESLAEAGDDLFTFLRFPRAQWKA